MKTIPLSQDKVSFVDDSDYESLNRYKWFALKRGRTYYAVRNSRVPVSNRRQIFMHRSILNVCSGVEVDHRNRNGLDNQKSNLRLCTHRDNMRNQRLRCTNKSGFKGVILMKHNLKKPYWARIRVNNGRISIGCYRTAEEAAWAYDAAALRYHGDYAVTNEMLGLL